MKIQQLIEEQFKSFDKQFQKDEHNQYIVTFSSRDGKPLASISLSEFRKSIEPFVYSKDYTKKLIEAVGEEIIGEDDECRFDAFSDPDTIIDRNELREEQRINLKEILSKLK